MRARERGAKDRNLVPRRRRQANPARINIKIIDSYQPARGTEHPPSQPSVRVQIDEADTPNCPKKPPP